MEEGLTGADYPPATAWWYWPHDT